MKDVFCFLKVSKAIDFQQDILYNRSKAMNRNSTCNAS